MIGSRLQIMRIIWILKRGEFFVLSLCYSLLLWFAICHSGGVDFSADIQDEKK